MLSSGCPLSTYDRVLFTAKALPCTETRLHKRPWHGSRSRRCSSKATERTGLTVIWYTVKDPRNLHSNCVPVGRAELSPSLTVLLLLALIPKLASALLVDLGAGAGGGPGQRVYCGKLPSLPLLNIQQHIQRHVYTHSRLRAFLPLCFRGFTSLTGFNLSGFLLSNLGSSVLLFRYSKRAGQGFNVNM